MLLVTLALVLGLWAGGTGPAVADRDHERARRALERGEVLPLDVILARIAGHVDGAVLEVELERDDGRFVYELEVMDRRGRLREIEVDAATGTILRDREDD
jgi:uncharacterized membrane protein YkoI